MKNMSEERKKAMGCRCEVYLLRFDLRMLHDLLGNVAKGKISTAIPNRTTIGLFFTHKKKAELSRREYIFRMPIRAHRYETVIQYFWTKEN